MFKQMSSRTPVYPATAKEADTRVIPLRAGIVGGGLMGHWHAEAARRAGAEVSVVMDVNKDVARSLAAKYRNAKCYTNLEEMFDQAKIDVLHICTPPATHSNIAEFAIDARAHLIIEKPVTPTAWDMERLLDQATDRGTLLCPVHQFIFQEGVLKAKQLLPQIGRLVHLEGVFCSAGGDRQRNEQINQIAADILPHPLSLMQIFLPSGLPSKGWMSARPGVGELRAFHEIDGTTLSIFISMQARPTVCAFRLIGSEGTIHVDMFHGYSFIEPGKVSRARKILHPFDLAMRKFSSATVNLGRRAVLRETAYPGLRRLVRSFYEAVQTKSPSPISRQDMLVVARVRDCLMNTASGNRLQ
jgi:predicted dehydrogenase